MRKKAVEGFDRRLRPPRFQKPRRSWGGVPTSALYPRTPNNQPLTTSPLLTPHSSPLTSHSSLLTPHSSPLTPHPSLLTPHFSLLTPHPLLLTSHSSLLTPHPLLLTPHAVHQRRYNSKARSANRSISAYPSRDHAVAGICLSDWAIALAQLL